MKLVTVYCVALLGTFFLNSDNAPFELNLKPLWKNLDTNQATIEKFGGKWVLAGEIDLRKRTPEPLRLNKFVLRWQGKPLNNLVASLYKKELDKKFLLIQDYLVCDSSWEPTNQRLILHFDHQVLLETRTIFYLVLTIPKEIETSIQEGSFMLESQTLPPLLKNALPKKPIMLTYCP